MPQPSISETEIVNRALVRLGSARIQDIGNMADPRSAAAATLYYELRDALLRRCRWNFARKFIQLAQLPNAPLGFALAPDPDYQGALVYTGAYQLPSDYLRLSAVSPFTARWRIVGTSLYTDAPSSVATGQLIGLQPPNADGADNVPASTGSPGSGRAAGIEYIARISDATKFDAIFAQCLALAMAYNSAFGNTAMLDLRRELKSEFEEMFMDARAIDGMEQWPEQLYDNVLVDVRNEYSGVGGGLF